MEPAPKIKFTTVDEYISYFPQNIKNLLEEVRAIIKATAPTAKEVISYNIPAFKLNGMLVFFAAWQEHIGMYPIPTGNDAFKKEIAVYKGGKGTLKFPFSKPLPKDLIKRIVEYSVADDIARAEIKKEMKMEKMKIEKQKEKKKAK